MSKRSSHDRHDRLGTDNEAGHSAFADCPDFADDDHRAGGVAGDPWNESGILMMIQKNLVDTPGVIPAARGMSLFGEHALGWMAISALGALLDQQRRRGWITVGAGSVAAHAVTVLTKRLVRRPRPHARGIEIGVATPSRLSFPSSHATSTTAALVLINKTTGQPWVLAGIPLMMLSRMVLGVHYPSDVAAGALVGWTTAQVADRIASR